MAQTRTIDDVVADLDRILERARAEGSRLGYFPALYRRVTVAVQRRIEEGFFEDGARLERLDVIFAGRYLDAFDRFSRGEPPTRSWQVALSAAQSWPPIVLQHLLLGINAHINLDLGIAAAEVAPGRELAGLRTDFDRINEVLAGEVATVREALSTVWPNLRFITRLVGTGVENRIINFSLEKARGEAWELAGRLAAQAPDRRPAEIDRRDAWVAKFGGLILRPGPLARVKLLAIRSMERGSVSRILDILS